MKNTDPTTRVSKDGHRLTLTEYEVRQLDCYGDSQNTQHYPTKREALAEAPRFITPQYPAVVVEKHVTKIPHNGAPDKYTVLATFGDRAALLEGGWIASVSF